MSVNSGSYREESAGHRCFGWNPIELIAMILGFLIFWPIGLAILFAKIWQSRNGYRGDLPSFVQAKFHEKLREKRARWERRMEGYRGCHGRGEFSGGAWNWRRSSGNLAFDEWREAELARLEEERQKPLAAEREFAEYMENLRRAKDREEFDRFMAARHDRSPDAGAPGQPA